MMRLKQTQCKRPFTFRQTIYLPINWKNLSDDHQRAIIAHESVHVKQYERYGTFGFLLRYLFLPLPIIFARCRFNLELEAFEAEAKIYKRPTGYYRRQFAGKGTYFFAWPWKSARIEQLENLP